RISKATTVERGVLRDPTLQGNRRIKSASGESKKNCILTMLGKQLRSEIEKVFGHHIELPGRRFVGLAHRSVFIWPVNESRLKAETAGGVEVIDVRRHHHDLIRLKSKQIYSRQVRFTIRLVVLCQLGGEDEIPWQTRVLGHVGQQRNVAVRQRGNRVFL